MFFDYHTHSFFSDDSDAPLSDMIKSGISHGLKEMAVTDHFDPGYPDPDFPFEPDFDAYHKALESVTNEFGSKIKIAKGLEVGIQHNQLDKAREAVLAYDYDYIIGSFHCASGEPLYNGHFFDGKSANGVYEEFYTYVFDNLKMYNDFCCLGHMNIIDRYAPEIAPFSAYDEIAEAILKHIIESCKGIELNTSSFRYNMLDTTPSEDLLKLYHSLNGEIITVGSDAHYPDHVAFNFAYAYDYLRSIGFKYVCTFEKKKPIFHKLGY